MKRTTAVVASIATLSLAASLAGCKVVPETFKGTPVTEDRTVTTFDSIELRGAGDVTVVSGSDYSLTVRANAALMDNIHTSIVGSTLIIDEDQQTGNNRIEFIIHVPSLSSVEVLGAGSVTVTGVDSEEFAVAVAGAADVSVSGRATTFVAVLSGVGDIDASSLAAKDVTARLSGVGSISVAASATLDAAASGVGEIFYSGDPSVKSKVTGIGQVTRG